MKHLVMYYKNAHSIGLRQKGGRQVAGFGGQKFKGIMEEQLRQVGREAAVKLDGGCAASEVKSWATQQLEQLV